MIGYMWLLSLFKFPKVEIKCVGLPDMESLQTHKQCQVLGSHWSNPTVKPTTMGWEETEMGLARPE